MDTDEISSISVPLSKRPISQKHRIRSHTLSGRKPRTTEFSISRTLTATSRPLSKLPNLLSKASIYSSTPEPMQLKRHHSQHRDRTVSSSSKLEQQSTTIHYETCLPILYSLINDNDQKRTSEFRRRQIYALNHLMRDLEQEQFRQFCTSKGVSTDKHEDTGVSTDKHEDTGDNNEVSTLPIDRTKKRHSPCY